MNDNFDCETIYNDRFIKIHTLGNFFIEFDHQNYTYLFENSNKLLELFKYFITFRDEFLLSEKIIDDLWPDSEFSDPKRTLRALVFRLRKKLSVVNQVIGSDIITYSSGCYKFNAKGYCEIDIENFESSFNCASNSSSDDRIQAIELHINIIKMYKGGFFCETSLYDWLVPIKNQYHHMYLHSCCEALDFLSEEKRYHEVVKFSEEIIKHDLYFEHVHFHYIESLVELGESKHAKNHLEYLKKIFQRDLGLHSEEIISKLNNVFTRKTPTQSLGLESGLKNHKLLSESSGPVECDYEFFKLYQKIEEHRYERTGKNSFWGTITIVASNHSQRSSKPLSDIVESLRVILATNLRKGDVFSQRTHAQFAVSLSTVNANYAEKAFQRVHEKFDVANNVIGTSIMTELFPY